MDEQEEKQRSKPGLVMLDDRYGFKVCPECYVFGVVLEDGSIRNSLYPTSIDGVFRLYSKQMVSDLTADKQLTIKQLLDVVNEVKDMVKEIKNKLEIGE